MKFDPTKPVQTLDGRKARIIATDRKGGLPIVALVEDATGCEIVFLQRSDGRWGENDVSPHDLVNVPESLSDRFWQHERGMAVRGSGLNREQSAGASIALMWVEKQLGDGVSE